MQRENHSLTTGGINGPYCLLLILSVVGVGISLYLTSHYMQVKFPQGLVETSACDINSFFNCDASTHSAFSSIFGLPISVFGLLFFINLIASCIFPHAPWERSNHALAWANVAGCLVLFLYSLFLLDTMCPFCMGHWIVSVAVALLFWKRGLPLAAPTPRVLAIYAGLAGVVLGAASWNMAGRKQSSDRMALALISQFERRPTVKVPATPNKIHMSTERFADAPLRISEFSDFQCPSCLKFAELVPKLIKRYRGKINIQYLFYPLDHSCNDKIKRPFHPLACQAAYLAHCAGEKFPTVHDEIFEVQSNLTQNWIDQKAESLGLSECLSSPETVEFVKAQVTQGNELEVTSTPTLIVNGKKIPGSLQLQQFYLLFDQILDRQ